MIRGRFTVLDAYIRYYFYLYLFTWTIKISLYLSECAFGFFIVAITLQRHILAFGRKSFPDRKANALSLGTLLISGFSGC